MRYFMLIEYNKFAKKDLNRILSGNKIINIEA